MRKFEKDHTLRCGKVIQTNLKSTSLGRNYSDYPPVHQDAQMPAEMIFISLQRVLQFANSSRVMAPWIRVLGFRSR